MAQITPTNVANFREWWLPLSRTVARADKKEMNSPIIFVTRALWLETSKVCRKIQAGRSNFVAPFLKHLSEGLDFIWYCLPPHGRSGGIHVGIKSISSHEPDETPGTRFFHPNGVNRLSRAHRSSFSPGSGPSSIWRAQAIPGHPGRARGLRTKETRAKRRGNFPRVATPR
jgi:hypothetical protein